MQTTITKISMKISNDTDRVKAYASIIINNSVKINGIKIVFTEAGSPIVVLPEGCEKKIQYVVPMNNHFRRYIDETLVERYFKLKSALNK